MARAIKSLHSENRLSPTAVAAVIRTPAQRLAAKKTLSALGKDPAEVAALLVKTYARRPDAYADAYAPLKAALAAGTATPLMASNVTNKIVCQYESLNSQVGALTKLRKAMIADGASQALLDATLRPTITTLRNSKNLTAFQDKRGEGAEVVRVPDRWRDARALSGRLADAATRPLNGDSVADLIVAAVARPSELRTLKIGDGKVIGMAKKRGDDKPMGFVSGVAADLVQPLLEKFQALAPKAQRALMRTADKFVKSMPDWETTNPNQLRLLRAFGADLAVRGSGARTEGGRMGVRAKALRHSTAGRPSATHHYAFVE